jgi:hypothetical protein
LELNRVAAKHSTRYGAVYRKAWTQNRENNPMQSRMGPRLAALVLRWVRGTRRKMVRRHGPHLISSRSSRSFCMRRMRSTLPRVESIERRQLGCVGFYLTCEIMVLPCEFR